MDEWASRGDGRHLSSDLCEGLEGAAKTRERREWYVCLYVCTYVGLYVCMSV